MRRPMMLDHLPHPKTLGQAEREHLHPVTRAKITRIQRDLVELLGGVHKVTVPSPSRPVKPKPATATLEPMTPGCGTCDCYLTGDHQTTLTATE